MYYVRYYLVPNSFDEGTEQFCFFPTPLCKFGVCNLNKKDKSMGLPCVMRGVKNFWIG